VVDELGSRVVFLAETWSWALVLAEERNRMLGTVAAGCLGVTIASLDERFLGSPSVGVANGGEGLRSCDFLGHIIVVDRKPSR
jgi:hypothetical protein